MSISVVCSNCSAKLNAPDSAAGKKVKSPKCQTTLVVPEALPEAQEFEVVDEVEPQPAKKPPVKAKSVAAVEESAAEAECERDVQPATVLRELGDKRRVERAAFGVAERNDEFTEFVGKRAAGDGEFAVLLRHTRVKGQPRHDAGEEVPPDALRNDSQEGTGIDNAIGERGFLTRLGADVHLAQESDVRTQPQPLDRSNRSIGANEHVLVL
jgi:hypothetical protein